MLRVAFDRIQASCREHDFHIGAMTLMGWVKMRAVRPEIRLLEIIPEIVATWATIIIIIPAGIIFIRMRFVFDALVVTNMVQCLVLRLRHIHMLDTRDRAIYLGFARIIVPVMPIVPASRRNTRGLSTGALNGDHHRHRNGTSFQQLTPRQILKTRLGGLRAIIQFRIIIHLNTLILSVILASMTFRSNT